MASRNCYIYTRVSTGTQVDGYSLDAQLECLRGYADYKDLHVSGEYCDAGKSGKNTKGRPEFCRMMDDVISMKDNVGFVLVFKLSRFGRNTADVLESIRRLDDYGVSLVSVNEAIDSSTSSGKLTLSILSAVAEMERDNISTQFMAGRIQSIKDGKWSGGPIPYGYRNTEAGLVPDPYEAEVVRKMFELYGIDGATATSVADELNRSAYVRKNPKGTEKTFTFEFVSTILDNPIYCGRILFNRRTNRKDNEGRIIKCDPENIVSSKGRHEALVTEAEWDRIHEKRKKVSSRYKGYAVVPSTHILSGLVRCPICGKGLVGNTCKSKLRDGSGRYGKSISYYVCRYSTKQNGHSCSFSRKLTEDILDGLVLEVISGLRFSGMFNDLLMKAFGADGDAVSIEGKLRGLLKELRKAESMKDRIGDQMDGLDSFSSNYDDRYDQLSEELDGVYDRIDSLEESVSEMRSLLDSVRSNAESYGNVLRFLENLKTLLGKMTPEEKKELCRTFIDRIEVFPEDRPDGKMISAIGFRFPVRFDGKDLKKDKGNTGSVSFTMDFSDVDIAIPEKSGIEMLTMDDGSRKVIVRKPTYPAIKRFVNERFGAKVSSLYIAQVKRKYGIDVRDSYNKPKKPDGIVPVCPAEKEKMILEALKSFGLVEQNTVYKEMIS